MILHVEGSLTPGAPPLPEYLKADVYLPPTFVDEHPDSHKAIAAIVQSFIEVVGVPTVKRWTRAGRNRGWSLSQQLRYTPAPHVVPHGLIPIPATGTSRYQFFGRPYGTHVLQAQVPNPDPVSFQPSRVFQPSPNKKFSPEKPSGSAHALEQMKAQLYNAQLKETTLTQQIKSLAERLDAANAENANLREQLANRRTPSSPSVSDISSIPDLADISLSPSLAQVNSTVLGRDIRLQFPPVNSADFPRPAQTKEPPFTPKGQHSPIKQRSANPSSRYHAFSPLNSTPMASHQRAEFSRDIRPQSRSSVEDFLTENGLEEKLAFALQLFDHAPVPSWHKLVKSFDITEPQREGLMVALTSDWLAGNGEY